MRPSRGRRPISDSPAPDLERWRRQASDLAGALRMGDPVARERLAAAHPSPPAAPRLADAQLVVAREHGFPAWSCLLAHARRCTAHGQALQHAYRPEVAYYAERADGLLASAADGTEPALSSFARLGRPVTRAGARAVIAERHGFGSWAALARHARTLAESGEPFARAFQAVEDGDLRGLAAILDRFPDLIRARGTNDNDLLGMATAAGDARLVAHLLERGAPVARANVHGWTALHQAAYAGRADLATMLLAAGAPVDVSARGDGGTPLVIALFTGAQIPDALLRGLPLRPRNLRVAAGLGRVDLVAELVEADGTLAPAAGAGRGFYRPHSGFPPWTPSDRPAEVRDEAVAWAARCGRPEAIAALVARGADPDRDVYRGTPLAWAAACGRVAAIAALLAAGADPNRRTTFGGPDHGERATPLHLAAEGGHREAIAALLAAGADPTARDARHDSPPAGWADHAGQPAAARMLRAAAG